MFVPVNSIGEITTVHCADGKDRVITIALTHSLKQFVKTTVGKIYENGEPMYEEGTKGQATGNHIHVEIAEGKYHQVKRMCERAGKSVVFLKRVAIGSLQLDPALECGKAVN